jgi:hypothetical protein
MWCYGLNWCCSGWRPLVGFCEHGNESSSPQNIGKFLSSFTSSGFSRTQLHKVYIVSSMKRNVLPSSAECLSLRSNRYHFDTASALGCLLYEFSELSGAWISYKYWHTDPLLDNGSVKTLPREPTRRNRTFLNRQRISKHASLTKQAVFSEMSVQSGYKEVFNRTQP